MTWCAGPVSPHCSADTRAEKLSLLSTKIMRGDVLSSSPTEGEATGKLVLFAEFKPPSWKMTATRVEKKYEDSGAELMAEGCQQGGCYYRLSPELSIAMTFVHFPTMSYVGLVTGGLGEHRVNPGQVRVTNPQGMSLERGRKPEHQEGTQAK